MHIADIDFEEFFAPAFPSRAEAEAFVREVEGMPPSRSLPKVLLHQGARMIWLGDRMDDIALDRPALKILFYLIAAEAVAKMAFRYKNERKSHEYVRRFFNEICSEHHRERLSHAFSYLDDGDFFELKWVIDYLYGVRCDVVHEGHYLGFKLPFRQEEIPIMTPVGEDHAIAHITIAEIRQIVLEGVVLACRRVF